MTKFYSASDVSFADRGGTSKWITSCKYIMKFIWGCIGFALPYAHSAERALCKSMKKAFLLSYLLCRALANLVLSALATALYIVENTEEVTQRPVFFDTDGLSNDTQKNPEMTTQVVSTTQYSAEGPRLKRTAGHDSYQGTHPMYDGLPTFWELKIVQATTALLVLTVIFIIVKLTLVWCSACADIYMITSTMPLLPTVVTTPKGWRLETGPITEQAPPADTQTDPEDGMQAITGPVTTLDEQPEVDTVAQQPAEATTDASDPLPRRDLVTAWIHQSEDASPDSPSSSRASSHGWTIPNWWHMHPQGDHLPVLCPPTASFATGQRNGACCARKSRPTLPSLRCCVTHPRTA